MSKLSISGFKDFLLKDNLIDVATGLVIGTAFTALVTAFTDNLIKPAINSLSHNKSGNGLTYQIVAGNSSTIINFSAIIAAMINFVLVAAVLYYLVIVPYLAMKNRADSKEESNTEQDTVSLLADIKQILENNGKTNKHEL